MVFGFAVPEGIHGKDVDGLAVEIQRIGDLDVGNAEDQRRGSVYAASGQLPDLERRVEHRQEALLHLSAQPEAAPHFDQCIQAGNDACQRLQTAYECTWAPRTLCEITYARCQAANEDVAFRVEP